MVSWGYSGAHPRSDNTCCGLTNAQLAIATLATTFTGAFLAMGGKKAEDVSQPPINAKSKDEESFVKCVDMRSSHHSDVEAIRES